MGDVVFLCETDNVAIEVKSYLKETHPGMKFRVLHRYDVSDEQLAPVEGYIVRKGQKRSEWANMMNDPLLGVALKKYTKMVSHKPKKINSTAWDYGESLSMIGTRLKQSSKKVEIVRSFDVECDSLEDVRIDNLSDEGHTLLSRIAGISSIIARHIVDKDVMVNLLKHQNKLGKDDLNPQMQPEPFTRHFLIDPILTSLGYTKILPERFIGNGQVDYSVMEPHKPEILIEAKCMGTDLEKDGVGQLFGYMSGLEKKTIGIVTNGVEWILIIGQRGDNVVTYPLDLSEIYLPLTQFFKSKNQRLEMKDCTVLDKFLNTFSKDNITKAHSKLKKDFESSSNKKSKKCVVKSNQRKK